MDCWSFFVKRRVNLKKKCLPASGVASLFILDSIASMEFFRIFCRHCCSFTSLHATTFTLALSNQPWGDVVQVSKCLLNNCLLGGNNVIKLRTSEEMMATVIRRNFLHPINVIQYSDACFGLGVRNSDLESFATLITLSEFLSPTK